MTPDLRRLVKAAIAEALAYEGIVGTVEVSVTFVDNAAIRELNNAYRTIDRETDVLSFPMYERGEIPAGPLPKMLGDIVLSLEKAVSQAEEYRHSFEREVAFLTVHSVLHLLGYDHEESEREESEMFARQEAILVKMGLPREKEGEETR